MYKEYLFSRKHNGEEYKFYLYRQYFYYGEGHPKESHDSIHVETPENAFRYTDTVLLSSSDEHKAYTLYRHMPRWILKKLEKQMKAAMKKYCEFPLFEI